MKIIVIDDNVLVLKQLSKHLEKQGHKVLESSNAMDALSDILKFQPDLVISDLLMPYLTGNELAKTLNYMGKSKTKMLFITSLDKKYLSELDGLNDYDDILKKPLNFSQLDQKIEALVA